MKTFTNFFIACFFFLCVSSVSATDREITKTAGTTIAFPTGFADEDVLIIKGGPNVGDTLVAADWTVLKDSDPTFHLILETTNTVIPNSALSTGGALRKLLSIEANNVITIGNSAFKECKVIQFVIAKSAKTIGADAFVGVDEAMRFFSIPSVETIGSNALNWPAQRLCIIELGSTAPSVSSDIMYERIQDRIILVPEGTTATNYATFLAASRQQFHIVEKAMDNYTVLPGSSQVLTPKFTLPFCMTVNPWGASPNLMWYKDGSPLGDHIKADGTGTTPLSYSIADMAYADEGTYTLQFSFSDGVYTPYMQVPLAEFQVGLATSIDEIEASNLIAFNNGIVTFSADVTAYELYSLSGQLLKTGAQNTISLDKGAYIIKAIGTQATGVKKIVW